MRVYGVRRTARGRTRALTEKKICPVTLERGDRIKVNGDDRVFRVSYTRPGWRDHTIQVVRVSWVVGPLLFCTDLDLIDDSQVTVVETIRA